MGYELMIYEMDTQYIRLNDGQLKRSENESKEEKEEMEEQQEEGKESER